MPGSASCRPVVDPRTLLPPPRGAPRSGSPQPPVRLAAPRHPPSAPARPRRARLRWARSPQMRSPPGPRPRPRASGLHPSLRPARRARRHRPSTARPAHPRSASARAAPAVRAARAGSWRRAAGAGAPPVRRWRGRSAVWAWPASGCRRRRGGPGRRPRAAGGAATPARTRGRRTRRVRAMPTARRARRGMRTRRARRTGSRTATGPALRSVPVWVWASARESA